MITFDLKSGYHHIEIHPDHLRFLGFAWKFPGEASIQYFVFTVLPFRLSSAPYIFTTINLLYLFIYVFKRKIIYVHLSVAN